MLSCKVSDLHNKLHLFSSKNAKHCAFLKDLFSSKERNKMYLVEFMFCYRFSFVILHFFAMNFWFLKAHFPGVDGSYGCGLYSAIECVQG